MESVNLELRPRLRSLSAYISLENNIDTSTIKVKLLEDVIEIRVEDQTYILPLINAKLLPSSLSSLGITNRWISFRIQTQPSSIYGKFETEVIKNDDKSNGDFINNSEKIELPPKNTDCKLFCSCCKNEITKIVSFQRVLPLPSSDCDPQEWFCHKHGDEEPFSLDPKESDLFYSVNYLVLNKNVFIDSLKLRNSLINCNRCFSILGSLHGKESKSMKIWNCCIEYKTLSNESAIKRAASPLSDFLLTVKDSAELTLGEKILLEAQDENSLHYILLRPMEAKLNILTEDKINSVDQTIKLKSSFVVKVLYKYGVTIKTTKHNDPNVKYCEVALPSILAGMDKLVSSSTRFPPAYRKAEDFYIGYLPI